MILTEAHWLQFHFHSWMKYSGWKPNGHGPGIWLFIFLLLFCNMTNAAQKQPDAKRIRQIQAALADHGFASGKTWRDTQEVCRDIAVQHGWQTHYAPDARVLILIGLGNQYSDQSVTKPGSSHLDDPENIPAGQPTITRIEGKQP